MVDVQGNGLLEVSSHMGARPESRRKRSEQMLLLKHGTMGDSPVFTLAWQTGAPVQPARKATGPKFRLSN